jgi:hypothetical protein
VSTDQTPALARATEALPYAKRSVREAAARAAVSAALHDPDHPGWLAEALYRADYPLSPRAWDDLNAVTHGLYRQRADAVRAAILGEA